MKQTTEHLRKALVNVFRTQLSGIVLLFVFVLSNVQVQAQSITITSHPSPQTTCEYGNASFSVSATASTPLNYQWQFTYDGFNWNNANFAPYFGGNTSTLTIVGASMSMNTFYYRCVVSSSCCAPVNSAPAQLTVNASTPASVSIGASATSICSGTNVTFTATPTNGGTPSYQWKKNGVNVGTNSATYVNSSLANGDIISCVMTSSVTCAYPAAATSNSITMSVTPTVTPSVSVAITSGTNPMCAGSSVTYTATPTNGGSSPSYSWEVNSIAVGTGTSYTSSSIVNGDVVRCILTSNATCRTTDNAISNSITMTVNPVVTPTISISASATRIYAGNTVNFTSSITNGGSTPAYQWKVNGSNVGTNSPTYSSSTLANGDVVTCVLTSNASCASTSTATSNSISISVCHTTISGMTSSGITGSQATLSWSGNADSYKVSYKKGSGNKWNSVTVTPATVTLTGLSANSTYTWYVQGICNGVLGPQSVNATFTTTSGARMSGGNTTDSDPDIRTSVSTISLYPNPAKDIVKLYVNGDVENEKQIRIYDMMGKEVYAEKITATSVEKEINIQQLPASMYIVKIIAGNEINSIRFTKE